MPYVEKAVDVDRDALAEMVRKSGQSGVPVIEVNGQVIVGFDRPRLEKVIAVAGTGKVSLGAAIADATKIMAKRGQIPVFGAYVGKVNPGSPAQKAGIEVGDIITELNLRPVANAGDVELALANIRPGGKAHLVFQRGNKVQRTQVSF